MVRHAPRRDRDTGAGLLMPWRDDYHGQLAPATVRLHKRETAPDVLAEARRHDYWIHFRYRGATYIKTFDGVSRVRTRQQAIEEDGL